MMFATVPSFARRTLGNTPIAWYRFYDDRLTFPRERDNLTVRKHVAATSYVPQKIQFVTTRDKSTACSAYSVMQESYQDVSCHQYSVHTGCEDLLMDCMERLAMRTQTEDKFTMDDGKRRRRQLADLGSADGTNSIQTLQVAINRFHQQLEQYGETRQYMPIHVTLEEQPSSNIQQLHDNLKQHHEWFQANNVTYSVLSKSFYEPLFEPQSMDFIMSYISLHWLDTSSVQQLRDWKRLDLLDGSRTRRYAGVRTDDPAILSTFCSVQEASAPASLREAWRTNLATPHLARFLVYRARELRPGAELLITMVAHPHEYICPSQKDQLCPLTTAMQRLIQSGKLRRQVLENTILPCYLRSEEDVYMAYDLACKTDDGLLLELVQVVPYQAMTGGSGMNRGETDGTSLAGPCDLFWAIHGGSVVAAGATIAEQEKIRSTLRQVFEELYDPHSGVNGNFLACLFRKRTRKPWR